MLRVRGRFMDFYLNTARRAPADAPVEQTPNSTENELRQLRAALADLQPHQRKHLRVMTSFLRMALQAVQRPRLG